MTTYTATYSPDDNKLRLYASTRLDEETYARVKAHGFRWAPKQDLFVAPMWTPEREDLLVELAGEIEDEDKSLVERAEERAERFEDYSEKRAADAERAHDAVARIADNIPLGQPILVGHHSEKRARKDQERIQSGMRRAVDMWKTSKYWTCRAAGAISAAKYKEAPQVRHRRIKTIESDKRKTEKALAERVALLALWQKVEGFADDPEKQKRCALALANRGGYLSFCFTLEKYPRAEGVSTYEGPQSLWGALDHGIIDAPEACRLAIRAYTPTGRSQRWIEHYDNRLAYERAMLAEQLGAEGASFANRFDFEVGGRALVRGTWMTILRVNKSGGVVTSVTLAGNRYSGPRGVEEVTDYQAPSADDAKRTKAATAVAPICNYPGEGFEHMDAERWAKLWRNGKGSAVYQPVPSTAIYGKHRVRQYFGAGYKRISVFVTDAKRVDPPSPEDAPPTVPGPERVEPEHLPRDPVPTDAQDEKFRALEKVAKAGVQVVVAPQLFPTPADVAERMVLRAGLRPGDSVLEPEAGTGAILRAINDPAHVVAVEINPQLARAIPGTLAEQVKCGDFLAYEPADLGRFDAVLMNPPFANGADIKHILHARRFLKPGGVLVAICANGPRQQAQLQGLSDAWEELPEGTFKEQGTSVRTVMLTMLAPQDAPQPESPKQASLF